MLDLVVKLCYYYYTYFEVIYVYCKIQLIIQLNFTSTQSIPGCNILRQLISTPKKESDTKNRGIILETLKRHNDKCNVCMHVCVCVCTHTEKRHSKKQTTMATHNY